MKLVIGGATGTAGTETLRQALQSPAITSVITIGRKPVELPEGLDTSKLHDVVLDDFTHYPDNVKKQLADIDACIWTIAITPSKSKNFPWEEVKKVANEYSLTALKTMVAARSTAKPLRFIYYSGIAAERDQTKTPPMMPQLCLMRGKCETDLLEYAATTNGAAEVCNVKPGLIKRRGFDDQPPVHSSFPGGRIPSLKVEDCVAATLKLCVEGIDKDPLFNDELEQIGRAYLEKQG